jgi:hypothetical protein
VLATRYTTDGSDPTTTSTPYSVPFTVSTTTTVKFRSWDIAGNVETTRTTKIQVQPPDTTPPTVSITSPSAGATVSGTVRIQAGASDAQSGVATVQFFADGQLLGTSTTSPFRINWDTRGIAHGTTHILTAVAVDRAGNTTTSATVTIKVA